MVLPVIPDILPTGMGPMCSEQSGCTFTYGLPDQTFNDFTTTKDDSTYTWRIGTLARDKPIFKIQESTTDVLFTTGPFSMWYWLDHQNDIPKAPKAAVVRKEPLAKKATDPYFEAYKVVAQECAKKCKDESARKCTGVHTVMRVVKIHEIALSDDPSEWSPVVNNKKAYAYSGMDHMAFVCYGFDDSKLPYLRSIDTNHKVEGTRQFKPLDVDYTETDYSVLFSHYWTKQDYTVIPHGSSNEESTCYNPACTFPHGLPNESVSDFATSKDDITYNWRLGTLASDKPIFKIQDSTKNPVFVTGPFSMWYWLHNQDKLPKGEYGNNIRFQLLSKKATDPYWNAYKVVAQNCADECQKLKDCTGVHPVLRLVKIHEIAHSDDPKEWSPVVNNKKAYADSHMDHMAFVCYGFDDSKVPYLRAIDTNHKVEGTRQFKPLDVDYTETDHSVLFSHYWTKNDFNVTSTTTSPPSTTTAIPTTTTAIPTTKSTTTSTTTSPPSTTTAIPTTTTAIPTTTSAILTTSTKHIIDANDACFCDGIGSASKSLATAVELLEALQKLLDKH